MQNASRDIKELSKQELRDMLRHTTCPVTCHNTGEGNKQYVRNLIQIELSTR